jgi:hypothetical protein
MEIDTPRGEGFRSYYIQKIEELQLIVNEKSQNLRRLQAQRNELNAKGKKNVLNKLTHSLFAISLAILNKNNILIAQIS